MTQKGVDGGYAGRVFFLGSPKAGTPPLRGKRALDESHLVAPFLVPVDGTPSDAGWSREAIYEYVMCVI